MIKSPRVSFLLPVYNGAPFLASSIDSILSQSFADFELLILNDGSTDNSAAVAQSYQDSRIRYFEHANRGLPQTLNDGARIARGEFLFRQDQDDISYPERVARQVAYLDAHPDVAMLGTWSRIFVNGDPAAGFRYHRHPVAHASIALCAIFDSPFVHSSVAFRRPAFEALGGYSCDPMRQPPEDFELWSRMCRHYQVANLAEILVDYREVASSMSRVCQEDFTKRMLTISAENLRYWLDGSTFIGFSDKLARIYHLNGQLPTEATDGLTIKDALAQIERALGDRGDVHSDEFKRQMRRIRHQLMCNHWLGRNRNTAVCALLKAVFRAIKKFNA